MSEKIVSAFAKFEKKAWPHNYEGTMRIHNIAGGTPTNQKVAESWLRTKFAEDPDDLIRQKVVETMTDQGLTFEEALDKTLPDMHLNGFKRDKDTKQLYIEGRQLKAAMKEAASVAVAAGKLESRGWGKTNKGLQSFLVEHICVVEDILLLGVQEPTGIAQRFVHTFRGNGIQNEEYVTDVDIHFNIRTDYLFSDEQWAMIWLTGAEQGIGASRSQGYGRYVITEWKKV